jgi:hypothetical protein
VAQASGWLRSTAAGGGDRGENCTVASTPGSTGDGDDQEGQVQNISGSDIRAQATFIAGLLQIAA